MTTVTLALAVPLSLHHHNDVDPCPTKAFLRKEDASPSSCVSFSCATSVISVYTAATRQHSQVAFATTTPPNATTVYIETSIGSPPPSHSDAVLAPPQGHLAQDSESSAGILKSDGHKQTSPSTSDVVASSVEDKVSNASSPLVSLPCDVVSHFIEICSQWGDQEHGFKPPVENANSKSDSNVESNDSSAPASAPSPSSAQRVLPRVPQCIVDALPMIKHAAGIDSPACTSSSSGLPLSGTEQQQDDMRTARATTSTNESAVAAVSFFSQCIVTDVAVFRGGFAPAPASSPKGAVVRATVTSLSDAVRPLWPRVASAFTATVATAVRHRSEMIRARPTNSTNGDETHNEENGNALAPAGGPGVEVAQQQHQNVDKSSDFMIGENASVDMTETQRRCFPLPCNTVGIVLRRDEVAVWLHDVATKPFSIATTTTSGQITSAHQIRQTNGNGGSIGVGGAGQNSSVVVASNTAGHLCLGSGSSTATDAPVINGGGSGGGGGALPASAALSPPTTNASHNGRGQHSTSSSGSHPSYGLSGQPSGNFSHASGHLSGHPSGHPSGVASTASFQGSGDVSPTHAIPISMNAGGLAALTSPLSAPSAESHSAPLSGSGGGATGPPPRSASVHGYHMLPTPALTISAPSGTFSAGNNSSDQLSQWALCKACCYTPSVDVKDAVKTLLLAISADASSEKRPANETEKVAPNTDYVNNDEGGVKAKGEQAKTAEGNGKVDASEEKTGVLDATSLSVVMRTTAPTRSSRGGPRPAPQQQPPVGEAAPHGARDNTAAAASMATARSGPTSGLGVQEGHRSQEAQGQEAPEHQRQGSYHHHPYSPEKQQLVAQAQREEAMRQDRARLDRHRQTEGHEQQYPPGCHDPCHSTPDHRGQGHGRYGSTGLPHPHPRPTGGRHALGFDDQLPTSFAGVRRGPPHGAPPDERQRYYDHDFSAGHHERQWSDQQAHRRAVSDYEYDGQRALSDMELSGHRGHDRAGSVGGGHHRDHSWSGECHQRQSSLGFMGPHPPHMHQHQQQQQQQQQQQHRLSHQSHRREGSDLELMSASANTPPVGPYAGAPYPQQHRPIGHGPSASAQAIALLAAGASPNGPSGPTGRVPISPPPASLRPASGGFGSHPQHSPPIDGAGATRGSHERHVSGGSAAAGHRRQGSHGSAVSGYRYDPYGATHNRVASDMLMDDDCSPADRETALVTGNANITTSVSATAAAAASVGSNARCESRGSIAERVTPRGHSHNTPPSILRQAFGSGDRSGEHERDQETSPATANPHARPESRSNRNTATGNGDTSALELETTTTAGRRSHRRQVSAPPVIMPHPHDRTNKSSAAALSETRKGFAPPPQVLSAGSVPANANGTDSSGGVNGSDQPSTSSFPQQQQRSPQERSAARGHGRQVSFGDDLHHRHTPSPQQMVADSQATSYSEGQHVRHTHRHQLSNASATSNTSAIGALSRAFAGPSPNSQNHPSTCQAAAESHLGGQWEGGEFTAEDRLQFRRGSQDSRQEMQDRQDRDRHARTLSEQFLKVHSRQMSRSDAAMNAFDIDPSRVFGVSATATAPAPQDTAATSSSAAQPSPQPHQPQHQQNSQPPHDPSQGQVHPHGPGPQYQNQFPQPHQHHHQHHQQQPQQQHRPVGQIPPYLNQGTQQQGLLGRTAGVAVQQQQQQQQQQQLPSSLLQQHQQQQKANASALRVAAPSYSPPVRPVAASVASVSSIPISPMASGSTIPTNAGVSVTVGTGNTAGGGVGDVEGAEPVKKKKKVKRGCRAGRQVKERKAMKEDGEGEEAAAAGECLASRE